MKRPSNGFHRASVVGVLLAAIAVLYGCASGPATRTEMLGNDSYLVFGSYGADTKTEAALKKAMQKRSDTQCPGGWSQLSSRANPHAVLGGQVWKIQCDGSSVVATRPSADSGVVVTDNTTPGVVADAVQAKPGAESVMVVSSYETLLDRLSDTAQKTVPGLTPMQAVAVARAELKWLSDKGISLVDADGKTIRLP